MRVELRGTLTERPSGTATARFDRATVRGIRTCNATAVAWEAHRPAAGFGEPALVEPDAILLGPTSQRHGDAPRGIALRISPDGRSVSRALYGVTLHCSDGYTSPTFDLPRASLPILADGRVSDRESDEQRTFTTIMRYTERFAATVGSGGAQGMFSVTLSLRHRTTGKRIASCRSGSVRWSATV